MEHEKINKEKPALKVLVVDDEPIVSEIIKRLLEMDGHVVQTANSSIVAMELFEQNRFDLITTDFTMSKINGETLATAIKKRLPGQPILMISANGQIAKTFGDALPDVDMVIGKPFSQKELREAMTKVLS